MTTIKMPILATYDRQTLICASIQLLNKSLTDNRSLPSTRFIRQWLPDLEDYEISAVMVQLGREYGYQALNQLGKWATCSVPLSNSEKAFKWIARQPNKLVHLQTIHEILRAYGHSWPLAESVLFSGSCYFETYMAKPKIKAAHDRILNTLWSVPTTLNELNEYVGDCRDHILQLRALGHEIEMCPYWSKETGDTRTQFSIAK